MSWGQTKPTRLTDDTDAQHAGKTFSMGQEISWRAFSGLAVVKVANERAKTVATWVSMLEKRMMSKPNGFRSCQS